MLCEGLVFDGKEILSGLFGMSLSAHEGDFGVPGVTC